MSIIRLIHIKIDPSETETAERIWKTECATLMISQKGCISEKLLRARERGEFISYSEWETEADIERYTNSAAHKQIFSHTRSRPPSASPPDDRHRTATKEKCS